mgnify:CR=1 FL=1
MHVVEVLENAPMLIAQYEEIVTQKQREMKLIEHNLEVARAMATVKGRTIAKNQKILEALVSIDVDVVKYETALIEAVTAVKLAEIDLHELENQFTSARKLANLQITVSQLPSVREAKQSAAAKAAVREKFDPVTGELLA